MTAFAIFLSEKIERYIELRRSLGYTFDKQAGTLRTFIRHAEQSCLDGPATRTMALDFVLSFRGAANSRAVRQALFRKTRRSGAPMLVTGPGSAASQRARTPAASLRACLPIQLPTIDVDHRPAQIGRPPGRTVQHHVGHLCGLGDAAEGHVGEQLLPA